MSSSPLSFPEEEIFERSCSPEPPDTSGSQCEYDDDAVDPLSLHEGSLCFQFLHLWVSFPGGCCDSVGVSGCHVFLLSAGLYNLTNCLLFSYGFSSMSTQSLNLGVIICAARDVVHLSGIRCPNLRSEAVTGL